MSLILGIDAGKGYVFEGESENMAHRVWPLPVMTPANFVDVSNNTWQFEKLSNENLYYFREDFFDPVSRVRRGRFYKATGYSTHWKVKVREDVVTSGFSSYSPDVIEVPLHKYTPYKLTGQEKYGSSQILVVLGDEPAISFWRVAGLETILTGEQLVTIRARQSIGVLPEINWSVIPGDIELLKEKIESLLDDVYRAGAESVVDRTREAATAILSAYLQGKGVAEASGKDLGVLTDLFEKNSGKNSHRIVRCAAEIPQRFHSRGKYAEQEKRENIRPIREQDAELAVQCIGVMLCDLGWGKWI
jgi:hypothetical protein